MVATVHGRGTSADAPQTLQVRRRALVEQIAALNRSAEGRWLSQFDDNALEAYLEHLHAAQSPRGGDAVWVRRAETPAIVRRVRQDA